ncbi:MAG: type 1 glutamine amidotransferase, partial [Hyphomicrobiales bacterium]
NPGNDSPDCLPDGAGLKDFDGIAWTGSAAHAYSDEPSVKNQISFARLGVESGRPVFGSCFGMQIVAQAFGGQVRASPNGREIGVGRKIRLSREGLNHPMYRGKPACFSALTVHMDEVAVPPKQAVILSGNEHSAIQSFVMEKDGFNFWGVQYHPEHTLETLAAIFNRDFPQLTPQIIKEGFFTSRSAIEEMSNDWITLHNNPDRKDLAWRYGIDKNILTPACHLKELANWLDHVRRKAGT